MSFRPPQINEDALEMHVITNESKPAKYKILNNIAKVLSIVIFCAFILGAILLFLFK